MKQSKQLVALPQSKAVEKAGHRIRDVVRHSALMFNQNLSGRFHCQVFLKREDMQVVRSYKIRGSYNMISSLPSTKKGVVCASAGNHAQGVAYSCHLLKIKGTIYMPAITPRQKIKQVEMFGGDYVEIVLYGDNFDSCLEKAQEYAATKGIPFIPPFEHPSIIEGQATMGIEILADAPQPLDYVFIPIGGGGLAAGLGAYLKEKSPTTKIIGVEPQGAQSMRAAFDHGKPVTVEYIDTFVDGAAVKLVGKTTFAICKEVLDDLIAVHEGQVCSTMLALYNEDAIVVEPAGALAVAALHNYRFQLKNKNVVCIVSGSNNDFDRLQEVKERSLLFEGLKKYFILRLPQRAGALKLFVSKVLGPTDDITRFEYIKKNERDTGPVLVGIEMRNKEDYQLLIKKLQRYYISFTEINSDRNLFEFII
ncbi:MAG: threonine ammonia-lyase IlvA [Deltaproteobacteria bacterium]|nr:threonine ammonia-lyase IlvA [Deltaproteobacteria bacterium]